MDISLIIFFVYSHRAMRLPHRIIPYPAAGETLPEHLQWNNMPNGLYLSQHLGYVLRQDANGIRRWKDIYLALIPEPTGRELGIS
jgi:hypothetical protein